MKAFIATQICETTTSVIFQEGTGWKGFYRGIRGVLSHLIYQILLLNIATAPLCPRWKREVCKGNLSWNREDSNSSEAAKSSSPKEHSWWWWKMRQETELGDARGPNYERNIYFPLKSSFLKETNACLSWKKIITTLKTEPDYSSHQHKVEDLRL